MLDRDTRNVDYSAPFTTRENAEGPGTSFTHVCPGLLGGHPQGQENRGQFFGGEFQFDPWANARGRLRCRSELVAPIGRRHEQCVEPGAVGGAVPFAG